MSRLVLSIILILGLAACTGAPGATTAGPSQDGATPTTEPSDEPTPEPTPVPSAGPADLVLTEADVPDGFTLSSEDEITIASQVEDYGAELGPARGVALTDRGFVGGVQRVFNSDGASIVSWAWIFDNAAGARVEFDEVADVYVGACPGEIDTGGMVGDFSASWVCPQGWLLGPRPRAAVMFVQDGVMIYVHWGAEDADQPSNQQRVVDLARSLQSRIPS